MKANLMSYISRKKKKKEKLGNNKLRRNKEREKNGGPAAGLEGMLILMSISYL